MSHENVYIDDNLGSFCTNALLHKGFPDNLLASSFSLSSWLEDAMSPLSLVTVTCVPIFDLLRILSLVMYCPTKY